jgi:hypothetical protein
MLSRVSARANRHARRICSLKRTRQLRSVRLRLEALEARIVMDADQIGLPLLHSLPGAPTAIYLDFNGWAAGGMSPYDEDGHPTTLNPTEQAHVIEAWRQVADYFGMFNIDVTTEQTTRPKAWELISNSVSGGYSYVGVFPNSQPRSFLGSSFARDRESGMAHELGHNFGLNHQSDYDLWGNKVNEYSSGFDSLHGPIMGVDFAQQVHKWFLGHPSSSSSALQDDMAIIANRIAAYSGGVGYRAQDYGQTIDTATPLPFTAPGVQAISGIIESLSDTDTFSFTTNGGPLRLVAGRDVPSPVALKLEIFQGDGTLLAASDGPGTNQTLALTLPAGTYYAVVSSQGNYGDLGPYNLTVGELPAGWAGQDIGSVSLPGYSGFDPASATFAVSGSGSDIWGTADQFHYAYQVLTGDGSVMARVTNNDPTDPWSKAGVMIRNNLTAGSAYADMIFSGGGTASFQYRSTGGGSSTSADGPSGFSAPYWVQLVRSGNSFSGYYSLDGLNWTLRGSANIAMGSTVYIGLAVTSHNNGLVNNATFDSVSVTGTLGTPPPSYNGLPAPDGLTAALGAGTAINLSWNAVDGATGYALDRSRNGIDWNQIATTAASITSYSDPGLDGAHRYFYQVSALDATGRSVPSDPANLVNRPSAPFNVTVTTLAPDRLMLDWRTVSGDTGYRIDRSTDGVNFSAVGTVAPHVPSFINTGLSPTTTYFYRIVALSPAGDSPSSAVVSNVSGLAFTEIASDHITLHWNPAGGVSYRIQRSTDGQTYSDRATVTTTSYTDTSVQSATPYYYRVALRNAGSQTIGSSSVIYTATAPANPLPDPWSDQDVGAVGGAGTASGDGTSFTVIGSGADIWGNNDAFHFAFQPVTGDGSIVAQVNSLTNTDPWAKSGVMFRDSLAANARYVDIMATPGNGVSLQWRSSTGGGSNSVTVSGVPAPSPSSPVWLQLVRSGNSFTGYYSTNGTSWTQVGSTQTVALSSTARVGLAVTAHNNGVLATASFTSVQLTAGAAAPSSFTIASGTADFSAADPGAAPAASDPNAIPGPGDPGFDPGGPDDVILPMPAAAAELQLGRLTGVLGTRGAVSAPAVSAFAAIVSSIAQPSLPRPFVSAQPALGSAGAAGVTAAGPTSAVGASAVGAAATPAGLASLPARFAFMGGSSGVEGDPLAVDLPEDPYVPGEVTSLPPSEQASAGDWAVPPEELSREAGAPSFQTGLTLAPSPDAETPDFAFEQHCAHQSWACAALILAHFGERQPRGTEEQRRRER